MAYKFNPFTRKLDISGTAGGGGGGGTVTSITAGTGLTGGTITTSGTIAVNSSVVLKDANNNISANAFFNNLATITASGTQVVLTAASSPVSLVTGSGGQTIKLPNATTLTKGTVFSFNNNQSSGAILVNNNSNTLVVSIPSGGYVTVVLLDNTTAAGSWDRHDQSPSNVSWSTNTLDYPGSITSATWNGNTVAANRGGTGQSSPFVAGGIAYGASTSALGVTPIGTVGQVLTSAGAGTPTWTTPTTGTVTSVTGTSPIASSGGATPAISIANAAADGTTKGAAAFNASDFDATAGIVSIDYTNGQAASTSAKGFLTSTDWNTFNSKQVTITTGAVDNAILRADGTGGSTLQNSGLIVEDAIESFAVTGVASTDIITATGSAFANGQPVRFTALTGGSGLNTTTNYYVINVSGATFQVSTSVGGGASLFTTDITAGTLVNGHSVSTNVTLSENTTATNSDLVLTSKGTGALIVGPKPDGTTTGGNARGASAVDLQIIRSSNSQVASGLRSFIGGGTSNTCANNDSVVCGGNSNTISGVNLYNAFIGGGTSNSIALGSYNSAICGGTSNEIQSICSTGFIGGGSSNQIQSSNSFNSAICGGISNSIVAVGAFIGGGGGSGGFGNRITVANAAILGGWTALADRNGMQAHANGRFAANGDAQRARFVLRCKTTTNTAVEMALDGATTYLSIPSGKVIAMTINISGVKSDGTAVAHYIRQYSVKNVSGTSSQVYAPVTIGSDNAAGTTIALSANDADDTLRILVTGIASETWRWVASVDAVEIAYGT